MPIGSYIYTVLLTETLAIKAIKAIRDLVTIIAKTVTNNRPSNFPRELTLPARKYGKTLRISITSL